MHTLKVHLVSETPFVRKGNGVNTAFLDSIDLLREKGDIEVVINEEGEGDVFHCHTYGPYYFWKGRNYKGRRVHTAHVIPDSIKGSIPMWKFFMPFFKWYFKKVFTYADVVIALSPTVENEIRKLGVNTPIEKIYNPIFIDHWKRTQEKRKKGRELLGLSDDEFVVLGVGQLQPRKGVEDFLDVADAIPDARFVWVGGRPFGALTEGIPRINARMAHCSSHVRFTGMLDLEDMPYIYAAADTFLFPSYQENCPLAPMEAAASGLPVVYRDIKEYSVLYEYPYLNAKNTQEFIDFTRRLIDDKEFHRQAVQISRTLMTQFDKNTIREKLVDIYLTLSPYTSDAVERVPSGIANAV